MAEKTNRDLTPGRMAGRAKLYKVGDSQRQILDLHDEALITLGTWMSEDFTQRRDLERVVRELKTLVAQLAERVEDKEILARLDARAELVKAGEGGDGHYDVTHRREAGDWPGAADRVNTGDPGGKNVGTEADGCLAL